MKVINFLFILCFFGCAQVKKSDDPIKEALSKRNESYRQCYFESEQYKGRHTLPAGEMIVDFTLQPNGKVKDEKIVSSTFPKDPNFQSCVLEQIRKTPFEDVAQETNVRYPINFLRVEI
jgi:TonB family protein